MDPFLRSSSLAAVTAVFCFASLACPGQADDGHEEEPRPLAGSEVEQGLSKRKTAIDGCVSRARSRNPGISGKVLISGTIDTDGFVEETSISRSSARDELLERCLKRAVGAARFPSAEVPTPFEHGVEVKAARTPRRRAGEDETPGAFAFEDEGDAEAGPPALSRGSIVELVEEHSEALNRCYRAAIEQEPDLVGSIEVTFAVAPGGNVRSAVATGGSIENETMRACVARVVRGWRFAPTGLGGLQEASYDFVFQQE